MSGPGAAPAPRALVLALAALALAAVGTAAPACGDESSPRLRLDAPSWLLEGSDARLTVTPRGPFEGRRLALTVLVDGRSAGRVEGEGARIAVRIAAEDLPAGVHEVGVKSGSERTTASLRVVPRRLLWLGLLPLILLAGLARVLRRRRTA